MNVDTKTRLIGNETKVASRARPIRRWAQRLWTAMQIRAWSDQLWPLLKVLRLPILFTSATFLIFSLGQSKSVLEALSGAGLVSLRAATFVWAAGVWYSCRVLLYFHRKRLWADSSFDPEKSFLASWLPRLIGGVTFEAVGGWNHWSWSASFIFVAATVGRRKLLEIWPKSAPRDDDKEVRGFARWFFAISVAVFLVLSVLFATPWGIGIARLMGAGTIVCLGLACLTAILAGISILERVKIPMTRIEIRFKIPFEALLLAWLVFASWRNDNHALRVLNEPSAQEAEAVQDKRTLPEYFRKWWDINLAAARKEEALRGTFPVFLVSAEGGGIKAAYWTAAILSRLQDRNPGFRRHLFLVSSVSGGSLGASTFAALMAEKRNAASPAFEAQADSLLSKDHLSPVLSRFFFTDCLARFLPWAVTSFDRGRAMETSWEGTWKSFRGDDRFAENFHALWADTSLAMPALLLNGTHVESGKRVIASNLKLGGFFTDAIDLDSVAGPRFPLSAVASMSARFPFVTPSALILGPLGKWGHVVDGGYYENSGAATAYEALQALGPIMTTLGQRDGIRIVPYVIIIRDDPPVTTGISKVLNDLTDPFLAAYDTRDGRTSFSLAQLRLAGPGQVIECNLSDSLVPLGWFLSPQGVKRIRTSLDGLDADQFAKIKSLLAASK